MCVESVSFPRNVAFLGEEIVDDVRDLASQCGSDLNAHRGILWPVSMPDA